MQLKHCRVIRRDRHRINSFMEAIRQHKPETWFVNAFFFFLLMHQEEMRHRCNPSVKVPPGSVQTHGEDRVGFATSHSQRTLQLRQGAMAEVVKS